MRLTQTVIGALVQVGSNTTPHIDTRERMSCDQNVSELVKDLKDTKLQSEIRDTWSVSTALTHMRSSTITITNAWKMIKYLIYTLALETFKRSKTPKRNETDWIGEYCADAYANQLVFKDLTTEVSLARSAQVSL